MTLQPPKYRTTYPNRALDCENALDGFFMQILVEAKQAGWSEPETIVGLAELLKKFAKIHRLDPYVASELERVIPVSLGDINDQNRYRREGE